MNSSPRTMRTARRDRASGRSFVPVLVFTALTMCGALAPPVILAADSTVETQRNAVVVFTVISLLIGSVTAGLLFASPLRRRLTSTVSEADASSVQAGSLAPVLEGSPTQAIEAAPVEPHREPAPMWPQPEPMWPQPEPAPTWPQPEPTWPQPVSVQPQPVSAQPTRPILGHQTPPLPGWPVATEPSAPSASASQALQRPPAPQPQAPPQLSHVPPHPAAPPRPASPPAPTALPWSTGAVQPDRNWNPKRRQVP